MLFRRVWFSDFCERTIISFIWKHKQLIAKTILNNERTATHITIRDFKLFSRAVLEKITWYWHKNSWIDRLMESNWKARHNPHTYGQLNFHKEAKNTYWKKVSTFNNWYLPKWMATCRRIRIVLYISPCTKLKLKCIKDLNIKLWFSV